jgi:hypothetical protein
MAATVKLGQRPKSFKRTVKVPMHDGTEGVIEVSYIYRTRKEYGEFIDELMYGEPEQPKADEKAKPARKSKKSDDAAPAAETKFSMREFMERTAGSNADYLLKVIDGWNLDAPFNLANCQRLADELPNAVLAILDDYRAAIQDGRLKN